MFKLKADRLTLREADVTKQILDYLRVRRWRCERQQSGLMYLGEYEPKADGPIPPKKEKRYMRLGENGKADYVCLRPVTGQPGLFEGFYLELKKPGHKPNADQVEWMLKRQVEGFLAVWFDSLVQFDRWYQGTFSDSAA